MVYAELSSTRPKHQTTSRRAILGGGHQDRQDARHFKPERQSRTGARCRPRILVCASPRIAIGGPPTQPRRLSGDADPCSCDQALRAPKARRAKLGSSRCRMYQPRFRGRLLLHARRPIAVSVSTQGMPTYQARVEEDGTCLSPHVRRDRLRLRQAVALGPAPVLPNATAAMRFRVEARDVCSADSISRNTRHARH